MNKFLTPTFQAMLNSTSNKSSMSPDVCLQHGLTKFVQYYRQLFLSNAHPFPLQTSKEFRTLSLFATQEFLVFVQEAYELSPTLFREEDFASVDISKIYAELVVVFSAWRRLRWMRKSKEKWSEADFAANV